MDSAQPFQRMGEPAADNPRGDALLQPPVGPGDGHRSSEPGPRSPASRVCDRCIQKKIKCDLQLPACSRCFESGSRCVYSSTRRRPGPAPGSRRGTQKKTRPGLTRQKRRGSPISPSISQVLGNDTSSLTSCSPPGEGRRNGPAKAPQSPSSISPGIVAHGPADTRPLNILPHEESYLLKEFRDGIHEAIPIFQVSSFLSDCANSLYSRDLISTIVIITAKLTGFSFSADNFDIDARIDMILCSGSHEEDMFGDSPSIDQFRKACLLAFYEFHQFPGQQAWMRITKLTRTALWIGLDRLESHRARYPGWGIMSEQELDDWGLVWWCIYRLDSYANLSSGTPYLVDECLIDTCLAQDASAASLAEDLRPRSLQRNFLPAHPSGLRETITSIALDSPRTALFNFHIVTITALRLVGRSAQLFRRRPLQGPGYLADIERHLATVRLSLPANYLNTRRNAFSNEAGCDHHARLITLFHLYMTRLFLNIMNCSVGKEGDQWVVHWQEVLESCQDMASISEQWNSSHNLQVDPAISFTIFTALVFLDIHKKSSSALAFGTHSAMGHYETVLHKHLEQFATTWMLPKLLTLALQSFRETVTGPLSYQHIQHICSRFEAPLSPRWLQFLSTAQAELESI